MNSKERSRSRWPAKGYPGSFKNMEEHELLKYALDYGMINMSYVQEQIEMNKRRELLDPTISEVFDEWNDRRLPICGDFLRYGRIFLWENDIQDIQLQMM